MRRNVRNQRAESRTVQKSVQILLVVSGVVFLALGLALAVTGTSVDSAVGSVSDQLDADAPDDGSASSPNDGSGAGNETSGDDGSDAAANDTDGDTGGGGGSSDDNGGDTDSADDGGSSSSDGDTGAGDDDTDGGDGTDGTDGDDSTDSGGTQTLTTVVEDGNGNPIDNATVTVTGDDGSSRRSTVDGEATFDLEDGQYTVSANADGYNASESTVEIDGDDETVPLTLESSDDGSDTGSGDSDNSSDGGSGDEANDSDGTQTLTVVVEDGNGNPVDNATVTVTEETLFSTGTEKRQAVDDSGEATFDLEDGRYEVTAEADGYRATDSVEIDGSDETIPLTLRQN